MQPPEPSFSIQGHTSRFQARGNTKQLLQEIPMLHSHPNDDLPRKAANLNLEGSPRPGYSVSSSSLSSSHAIPINTYPPSATRGPGSAGSKKGWWQSLIGKGSKRGNPNSAPSLRRPVDLNPQPGGYDLWKTVKSNDTSTETLVNQEAQTQKRNSIQDASPRKSKDSVYGAKYPARTEYTQNQRIIPKKPPPKKPYGAPSSKAAGHAPPPKPQPNTSSSPSKKPAVDEERNNRHGEVVNLLSGRRKLSASFTQRYKLGEVLGDGAFGFVMTAYAYQLQREVAVKFIIRDKIPKDLWIKEKGIPVEIDILKSLRHPNIIKYIEHIHEPKYIILVTELHGTEWSVDNKRLNPQKNPGLRSTPRSKAVPNPDTKMECSPLFRLTEEQEKEIKRRTSCDLFECIDAHKSISEENCKKIIAQIALAVDYMNNKGIVHRDLKDENVVIDENYNVKIVDFGSASYIPTSRDQYFTKFNGTAHFASPEIAKGNAYRGPEAEVWYVP